MMSPVLGSTKNFYKYTYMDDKPDSLPESELKKIDKMLHKASKSEPTIRRKPKFPNQSEKIRLGTAIAGRLSEYIDSYILLGFDTFGNSHILINSANDMETRALSDLVNDFLSDKNNPINNHLLDDDEDDD
jgi:hypothetical protein